jgi:hypothetical protein
VNFLLLALIHPLLQEVSGIKRKTSGNLDLEVLVSCSGLPQLSKLQVWFVRSRRKPLKTRMIKSRTGLRMNLVARMAAVDPRG